MSLLDRIWRKYPNSNGPVMQASEAHVLINQTLGNSPLGTYSTMGIMVYRIENGWLVVAPSGTHAAMSMHFCEDIQQIAEVIARAYALTRLSVPDPSYKSSGTPVSTPWPTTTISNTSTNP